MTASAQHLVIFAKAPRMGRVKTRLARDIGTVPAWAFYRRQLFSLASTLGSDPRWQTHLFVAPDTAVLDERLWPDGVARHPQGSGDLGQRMQRAFDILPSGPAMIIGADIPGIKSKHIADGFRALGNHNAVFGPADDGGYWLVGVKRSPRRLRLFDGVRWSGPHALDDTLKNLSGYSVAMLGTLADVDDGEDFARLAGKYAG